MKELEQLTKFDFYFFRHGQCAAQLNPELVGGRKKESPLTNKGCLQAEQLACRLKLEDIKFDLVYSSTLLRAEQTATIVCDMIGYSPGFIVKTDNLVELDYGDWETQLKEAVYTPEVSALINFQHPWFLPPNGECRKTVQMRMTEWLLSVLHNPHLLSTVSLDGHSYKIGVFSHGLALGCLAQTIMGTDASVAARFWFDNCSISHLRFDSRGWHVFSINDTGHLIGLL